MRTSMIQLATLALAFSVSAMLTTLNQRNCEDVDGPDNNSNSTIASAAPSIIKVSKATTTKGSSESKSTTTKKASKSTPVSQSSANSGSGDAISASSTKKSSKSTTVAGSSKATTSADSGSQDSAVASSTKKSGSSKAASSGGSAATTAATTTCVSSSGSGSSGGSLPASSGTSVLSAAQTIAAGASFDGGMVMYDRGVTCTGQAEGDDSDAVFNIEAGGSLSNVIIGPNQKEGVHCQGACTLTNVWWSAVCEDAFTIKLQDAGATTKVIGGGAFGATDKVLQHNGAGTMSVSDFTVDTFGKLYRACGNCKNSYERHVIMDGITATDGDLLAGINSNFGDTATITNSKASGVKEICTRFQGVESGSEPTEIGSGADGTSCIFGSDVVSS